MKKDKENKKQKKPDHTIETPPPPQVMDPSTPPSGEQEEKSNASTEGYTFPKRKKADESTITEQLAPREEL